MAAHSPVQPAPEAACEFCIRATCLSGLAIVFSRKTKPPLDCRLQSHMTLSALEAVYQAVPLTCLSY